MTFKTPSKPEIPGFLELIFLMLNIGCRLPWWFSGKESACQCRRCGFNPWVCQDDPLEKGMATHSSILAWEIPRTEESSGLQSMGSQKSWTQLSN